MWNSKGPQRVKAILSGCLQTATARIANIIPVSVSPILTLDASHAAIGTDSLNGLIGLRFKPIAIDDAPISSCSSESPSSSPMSTRDTVRGLSVDPRSDCIDFVESWRSASGIGCCSSSGMLFNCASGSVSSWVRWSEVRFPQYWAGDPPLPPVPAPSLVSSWRGHLCFRLGRGGASCHASRNLVRLADSLD